MAFTGTGFWQAQKLEFLKDHLVDQPRQQFVPNPPLSLWSHARREGAVAMGRAGIWRSFASYKVPRLPPRRFRS
jgi:hypothetical protein